MIDKELRREITNIVNTAVRDAMKEIMLRYQEEIVSEEELRKRISIFTPSFMRDNAKFLPQAACLYLDGRGAEHETHTGYRFHAIMQMIIDDDLDFTRPDRVEYRQSRGKGKWKGNKKKTSLKCEGTAARASR